MTGRGESGAEPGPGDVEWLDLQPIEAPPIDVIDTAYGRPPRWRWHWSYGLIALAVLAGIVTAVRPDSDPKRATQSSSPSSSPASSPNGPSPPTSAPLPPEPASASAVIGAPVVVAEFGRPLLAVPGSWELFGRGPGEVVRIELARGRITTTVVPQLNTGGPVSFIAGPSGVIIRPLDNVMGYAVVDGNPPTPLPTGLRAGTMALPGPDPSHIWVQDGDPASALHLIDFDGTPTGASIPIPNGAGAPTPDGAGYVLFPSINGVYVARPGSIARVTTGPLLGVGATGWIVEECDNTFHCSVTVVDRASGRHRVIEGLTGSFALYGGRLSPDGRSAALVRVSPDGAATLEIVDLVSGTSRPTPVPFDETQGQQFGSFVWSPDSRWLFAVDSTGRPVAVERSSNRLTVIAEPTTSLSQLSLRVDG